MGPGLWPVSAAEPASPSFPSDFGAPLPKDATSHLGLLFLQSAKEIGDHPACEPLAM